jgi:hypothetical protein
MCRLLKSLYGLKQASRAWNQKFHAFIMKFGLTQSKADPCVYFQHQREGEIDEVLIILIIYVDDGIILSNRKQTLTHILDHLKMAFEIRSLPAHRFIGIDIIRDRPKRMVYISQPEYVVKIADKFNMSTCTQLTIPADPCCRLSSEMSPQNKEEEDEMKAVPYREAVRSLMHIIVITRPDIAYAIGQVAQYAQKPEKQHWRAGKQFWRISSKQKTSGYILETLVLHLLVFVTQTMPATCRHVAPLPDLCSFILEVLSLGPAGANHVWHSRLLKPNSLLLLMRPKKPFGFNNYCQQSSELMRVRLTYIVITKAQLPL